MKLGRLMRFLRQIEQEAYPDVPQVESIDIHANGSAVTVYLNDDRQPSPRKWAMMLSIATKEEP